MSIIKIKQKLRSSLDFCRLDRIPLEGPIRTEAIELLKARGINDQTKEDIKLCYDVAKGIKSVMDVMAESCFLHYNPSLSMPARTGSSRQNPAHETTSRKRRRKRRATDDLLDGRRHPSSESAGKIPSACGEINIAVCQGTRLAIPTSSTSPKPHSSEQVGNTIIPQASSGDPSPPGDEGANIMLPTGQPGTWN